MKISRPNWQHQLRALRRCRASRARNSIQAGRCASSWALRRAPPAISPRACWRKRWENSRPAIRCGEPHRRRQQYRDQFRRPFAPNDGYTLLQGTVANTINPVITANLSFEFPKDFSPISLFASLPNIIVVNPSLGVHSIQELIKLAREKPGQLSFGSAGVGGTSHFSGELFNVMAGMKLVHVPYTGTAQAATDLLGGRST